MPVAAKVTPLRNPLGPQPYRTIPEDVEAIQFRDWGSAIQIFSFTEGFMFVPRGYEHALRNENESDRGNGHILDGAPEFLVLKNDQGQYRIDLGCWLVKTQDGSVRIYLDDQFKAKYVATNDMF